MAVTLHRLRPVLPALILAVLILVPNGSAAEPVLTNAAQVRALSPDQAERHLPARLTGVVISEAEAEGGGLVVLDDTAGIYVSGQFQALKQLQRGDSVTIEGVTDPGEFAPILVLKNFRQIGHRPLPAPRRATYEEMISGSLDAQWVEVSGVVRRSEIANTGSRRWQLDLATGGGRLAVEVATTNSPEPLVDAEVRLRGICFYQVNRNRQLIQPELFVPYETLVQVESPAPPEPFSAPVCPIGSLMQFSPNGTYGHRRHLHGVVTACQPGRQLWIQDHGGGIRTLIRQTNSLALGDEVDVLGFPIRGGYSPILADAVYRRTGAGPAPDPISLRDPTGALFKDACLVQLNATLLEIEPSFDGCLLKLTESGESFTALLAPTGTALTTPGSWQVGSRVRLTGICSVVVDTYNSPVSGVTRPMSFQILLRSSDDVTILQRAAWFSWERGVWFLAATSMALAAIVLAVFLQARRRLSEQAAQRGMAERELTAILKERNRVAREIHDTLAQGLGAISIQIELIKDNIPADSNGAKEHLDQARALVRSSLADARGAIWNMRAQVLEQGALADALTGFMRQITTGSRVKGRLHQTGQVRRLAPLAENALLRLGQEAIANAVRHGKPTEVQVELEFGLKSVKLVVRDDGTGFNVACPPRSESGFGLLGMRERAEQMGGVMKLRSLAGQGTEIIIELPVPDDSA